MKGNGVCSPKVEARPEACPCNLVSCRCLYVEWAVFCMLYGFHNTPGDCRRDKHSLQELKARAIAESFSLAKANELCFCQ